MTLEYAIDGVALPAAAVLINPDGGQGFPSAAWYCDPMVADLRIDDPDGDYELEGWHTFTVEDDADADRPRIFTGWIVGLAHGRGNYRDGPGRVWEVQIADHNSALQLEVFRSTAASVRPAETDVERIQSAITSHAQAGTPVVDNGRLATDHPLNIDATNFVTQHPSDMIVSAAGQTNNNAYVYWDHAAEELALHYDTVGEGPAAQISVSNVPGDWDNIDVFPPFVDARKETDTSGLATGVLLLWTGGATYARNQTLIDSLSPTDLSPSEFLRDAVVNSARIGKATTAASYIQTQLAIYSVPRHTLTFTLRLPASKHNAIQSGDVVDVRFSHLVGYETSTPVMVIKRMVRPTEGRVDFYDIDYECADFGTAVGAGGGGVGGFPKPPGTTAGFIDFKIDYDPIGNPSVTLDAVPPEDSTIFLWIFGDDTPESQAVVSGFTQIEQTIAYPDVIGNDYGSMWYKVAGPSDPQTYALVFGDTSWIAVGVWEGLGALVDSDFVNLGGGITSGVPWSVGTVTATAPSFLISLGGYGDNNPPSRPLAPVSSTVLFTTVSGVPWWAGATRSVTAGTYSELYQYTGGGTEDGHAGIVALFAITGGLPTLPGQPAGPTTPSGDVDGSNTDFTQPEPFAQGSLRLLHDGTDQTSHVTDSDSEAGTFTLDYAPSAGSTLETYYQGHP